MNVFEVLNALRREKLVDFVGIHPQLCASDGDVFWEVFLKGADDVGKLVVAGCHADMQRKMFRDAFEKTGFAKEKHVGVDIRNVTLGQAVEAIKSVL
ncbi:heterodisulfide reductase subunit A-like protein [Candidatus Caldatribacterium sp. SIUC1]|uniref:heterodisulfide reductase subunit A-like protein n=1 Tax=Candidatus Caldatribacterium sp. SIUC1 TaxID=3418365 RepID=UPI003F68CB86